ncbi:MAG: hypothetical protein XXXJIFNMEKO3_00718 [Candidatus Erwinia impunctatus]|nr:hypothetical protein XXXJIFNMEKO_00718 [Culicoides impunctatus]
MSLQRSALLTSDSGFTLTEMLLALALSSVLFLAAGRSLPALHQLTLRSGLTFQLHEELQQIMAVIGKTLQRAGYCPIRCTKEALIVSKQCLLVRLVDVTDEASSREQPAYVGFRFREGNIETQRNIHHCGGSGWERINDPATIVVDDFVITRQQRLTAITLAVHLRAFPFVRLRLQRLIASHNL